MMDKFLSISGSVIRKAYMVKVSDFVLKIEKSFENVQRIIVESIHM